MGGVILTSCQPETYEIPASELYTRQFVKEFGVFDTKHDWNSATRGSVDLNVEGTTRVRVTSIIDGKKYLLADYDSIRGKHTIEFDIPKGVKDIQVYAGNKRIDTQIGSSISLSHQSITRSTGEDIEITVTDLEGDHSFLTLQWPEVEHFTKDLIKENNNGQNPYENTSLVRENFTKDFMAEADTFWIFPQYWNTGSYLKNQIGIYYYVDEAEANSDGVTAVQYRTKTDTVSNINHEYETRYIRRIPIFNGLIKQLQQVKTINEKAPNQNGQYQLSEDEKKALIEKDSTKYKTDENGILSICLNGNWYNEFVNDKNAGYALVEDLSSLFPEKYISYNWGELGQIKPSFKDFNGYEDVLKAKEFQTADYLRSTGVQIVLSKRFKFGFYLQNGENQNDKPNTNEESNIRYSEMALNPTYTFDVTNSDGSQTKKYKDVSYIGTLLDSETDTYGNDKRYLCFEDWMGYNTNFDINDMVFRIYGFDHLKKHPDPDGEIIDKENPDDKDEPFKWIVAAEDLGALDDFDFNDVVFEVEHVSGQKTATIKALAAGGTLPIWLQFNDADKGWITVHPDGTGYDITDATLDYNEWHTWFADGNISSNTMINTGSGISGVAGKKATINVPEKFSISSGWHCLTPAGESEATNMGGFRLVVEREDGTYSYVEAPEYDENAPKHNISNIAPQMICVPSGWKWPVERTSISTAYNTFIEWCKDKNKCNDWHKNHTHDKHIYNK